VQVVNHLIWFMLSCDHRDR